MKGLNKLATAIASAPFTANSLEALDDEFLGDVTGQEGITIDRTYMNTIEEFQYVDSDGDGSGTEGKIRVTDIEIGDFANSYGIASAIDDTGTLGQITESGQMIDATANGVLITAANVGTEAATLFNNSTDQFGIVGIGAVGAYQDDILETDSSGSISALSTLVASGLISSEAAELKAFGNGKDIRIGGIEIGNENGDLNSIGTATIINAGNYATSGRILTLIDKYSVAGGAVGVTTDASGNITGLNQAGNLFVNNANTFIERQTLISSKSDGTTGVVIESEGGMSAQALYYTDTDTSSNNSIGVYGLNVFRIASSDELGDNADNASGTYIRGSYSYMEIDVEDGKLVLSNQIKESNMVANSIFIGDVETYSDGSLGGIAILGNRWEGSTSIYAH